MMIVIEHYASTITVWLLMLWFQIYISSRSITWSNFVIPNTLFLPLSKSLKKWPLSPITQAWGIHSLILFSQNTPKYVWSETQQLMWAPMNELDTKFVSYVCNEFHELHRRQNCNTNSKIGVPVLLILSFGSLVASK